jgi:CubicO group peptidase (beta-lactamase class C family)
MKDIRLVLLLALWLPQPLNVIAQPSRLDSLDAFVREQMAIRHIPGLSLAVIQDGKVVVSRGYGVVDARTGAPVTSGTLFQAGSISKPVSALGALHLVEAGRLSLDGDVNKVLTSWRVPDNRFTVSEKVTLRRILSHNAGLTVHGFPGYGVAQQVPTLVQVLDGVAPANTPAIRVDTTPGAIWRYSGGGFTVMQQMIIDVTGMPFPDFMQTTVLGPIGMVHSSFEQPQPPDRALLTASGYYADRTPVEGRWHVYPEMAAAGLWTTPTDLARFAIEVHDAFAGGGHGVISPSLARQYLTVQAGGSGLGVGVQGNGKTLSFAHGGRDEGFDAFLFAYAESGDGVVIMINANDNSHFMRRVQRFIGGLWGWPGYGPPAETGHGIRVPANVLARYAGYYEAEENNMVALAANPDGTGLITMTDGLPDDTYLTSDSVRFQMSDGGTMITFKLDSLGSPTGFRVHPGNRQEDLWVPRVAPLFTGLVPVADPDPALTGRITSAVHAIRQGGEALASSPDLAPGTKRDFAGWKSPDLDAMQSMAYLGEEIVAGRSIHRHDARVTRVVLYRMATSAGPRNLLVHLDPTGKVADIDIVQN